MVRSKGPGDPRFFGLKIGRIVHFVLENGGGERPAVVVRVTDPEQGTINVNVFLDGPKDDEYGTDIGWVESVPFSDLRVPGTWHWPGEDE